jgi:hypothetical protein
MVEIVRIAVKITTPTKRNRPFLFRISFRKNRERAALNIHDLRDRATENSRHSTRESLFSLYRQSTLANFHTLKREREK